MNRIAMSIAGVTLLLVSQLYAAGSPKLAPDLDALDPQSMVDVIIQFNESAGPDVGPAFEQFGARFKGDLGLINAGLYSVPVAALFGLANNPAIVYISPDRQVEAMLDYANVTVNANVAVASAFDGTGVGVAVIDSGILGVKDLFASGSTSQSRVVYSQNFVSGTNSTADQYGHGTHVAGILGANGSSSSGSTYFKTFRGIAPNINLINLRVLDAKGVGTDSGVINAINRAIAIKNQYNIRVINLSLGRPVFESYKQDPLCQAVEKAWKAGIVVVVAAGNEGRNNNAGTSGYATITEVDPIRWTDFGQVLFGRRGLAVMPTFSSIEHRCAL